MIPRRRVLGGVVAVVTAVTGCTSLLGDFQVSGVSPGVDAGLDVTVADAPTSTSHPDSAPPPPTCTPGGACTTGCATGSFVCADGGEVCNATSAVPDGTACGLGTGHVCSGGTCVSCAAGQSCNDVTMPCVEKNTDCSTGAPVCKTTGNVPDGTTCGGSNYCYGGTCSPCTVGASCTPASAPCHTGTVSACTGGVATCTDSGADSATGTSCVATGGQSGVCVSGACEVCTPNAQCNPGGNVCQDGKYSCTAGPVCGFTQNAPDGTACGMPGQVCTGGSCGCASGQTFCSNGCADLQGDNGNCGVCGHACGAGSTCTSGFCTPVTVCTGGGGKEMALLGGSAYIESGNEIISCSLAATGAQGTVFLQNKLNGYSITSIMSDAKDLYFVSHIVTNGSNALNRSDGTMAGTMYIDGYPSSFNSSYVRTDIDPSTSQIFLSLTDQVELVELSQATDAGVPNFTCVAGIGSLSGVAAGGGKLFVADSTSENVIGLTVTSSSCSSPSTIAAGLSAPAALATNGKTVAFADANGVYACDTSLGCIPQMKPTPLATGQGTVMAILMDTSSPPNLYWVGSSGLVKCSTSAGVCNGKPTVLIPNATPTSAMALDSTYVYYLQGTVLNKVAK